MKKYGIIFDISHLHLMPDMNLYNQIEELLKQSEKKNMICDYVLIINNRSLPVSRIYKEMIKKTVMSLPEYPYEMKDHSFYELDHSMDISLLLQKFKEIHSRHGCVAYSYASQHMNSILSLSDITLLHEIPLTVDDVIDEINQYGCTNKFHSFLLDHRMKLKEEYDLMLYHVDNHLLDLKTQLNHQSYAKVIQTLFKELHQLYRQTVSLKQLQPLINIQEYEALSEDLEGKKEKKIKQLFNMLDQILRPYLEEKELTESLLTAIELTNHVLEQLNQEVYNSDEEMKLNQYIEESNLVELLKQAKKFDLVTQFQTIPILSSNHVKRNFITKCAEGLNIIKESFELDMPCEKLVNIYDHMKELIDMNEYMHSLVKLEDTLDELFDELQSGNYGSIVNTADCLNEAINLCKGINCELDTMLTELEFIFQSIFHSSDINYSNVKSIVMMCLKFHHTHQAIKILDQQLPIALIKKKFIHLTSSNNAQINSSSHFENEYYDKITDRSVAIFDYITDNKGMIQFYNESHINRFCLNGEEEYIEFIFHELLLQGYMGCNKVFSSHINEVVTILKEYYYIHRSKKITTKEAVSHIHHLFDAMEKCKEESNNGINY